MRGTAALVVVAALLAWDAWRGDLPEAARPAAGAGAATPAGDGGRDGGAAARPARDPFRFGSEASAPRATPLPEQVDARPPAPTPEPPQPVRLVGFIRQGEELRAALSVLGQVALAAEGESVDGYEVLALEDDVGVRVRTPEGAERELRLPPR